MPLTEDLCKALQKYIHEKFNEDFHFDNASDPILQQLIQKEVYSDPSAFLQYLTDNLESDMTANELKKPILKELEFLSRQLLLLKIKNIIVRFRIDTYNKSHFKPQLNDISSLLH